MGADLVFSQIADTAVPKTLYHYCSTETFLAILGDGRPSIRLSALSMSNDSEEGRLLHGLIDILSLQQNVAPSKVKLLKDHWNDVAGLNEGLGFCLSWWDDLLSQWRGYAAQGCGVSIGFDAAVLRDLG